MPADKKKDKQGDRSRSKERRSAAAADAEEVPASPLDIAATLAQILSNQNDDYDESIERQQGRTEEGHRIGK